MKSYINSDEKIEEQFQSLQHDFNLLGISHLSLQKEVLSLQKEVLRLQKDNQELREAREKDKQELREALETVVENFQKEEKLARYRAIIYQLIGVNPGVSNSRNKPRKVTAPRNPKVTVKL